MARAGELTGDLTSVLEMMSTYATRMAAVTHRVKMAMAYPLLLSLTAISIIGYQLLYIVPVFGDIFGELGAKLPAPTLFLLKVSEILRGHWPVLTVAAPILAVGVVVGYLGMRRNRNGRRWLDSALLYTPGIGVAYQGVVRRGSAGPCRFCCARGCPCSMPCLSPARLPAVPCWSMKPPRRRTKSPMARA